MSYEFTVSGRIARPVHDVFEAVADPKELSSYFTTGGAQGRLEKGATVTWDFHDFPGAFPVHVVDVVPDKRIVLRWDAAPDDDSAGLYQTTVTMSFEELEDGRTLVKIHEDGFRDSEAGRKGAFGNCEGWTGMLCALRVWKEHGIRFREGFYK
jgi:uncharacterized protein YndB with AHSA1/START domain